MRRSLLFLSLFSLGSNERVSASEFYFPTNESSCVNMKVIYNPKKAYIPKAPLNQGQTGTCYFHAAYRLLERLLEKKGMSGQVLSRVDGLGQSCNKEFVDGGSARSVLFNLRGKEIQEENGLTPESVFKLDRELKKLDLCDPSQQGICCQQISSIFSAAHIPILESQLSAIVNEASKEKKQFTYEVLSRASPGAKIKLPNYNVYSVSQDEDFEKQAKESSSKRGISLEDAKTQLIQKKVVDLLQHKNPDGIPDPIAFTFNTEIPGKPESAGGHAIGISDTRTLCCGEGKGRQCDQEWYLLNSYGGKNEGWHKAKPLVLAFQKDSHGGFTWIKACGSPGEEPCKDFIEGSYPVHLLVQTQNEKALESYLRLNPQSIHSKNKSGQSPLVVAAIQGHLPSLEVLLKAGAPLTGSSGADALIGAAHYGNLSVVKEFFKQGVPIDQSNQLGNTALYWAIKEKKKDVADWLIQNGAQIDRVGFRHRTALHMAAANGPLSFVVDLIKYGASLNSVDGDGDTPLLLAANNGKAEIADFLIQKGAFVDQTNHNGKSPLHLAAARSHTAIIQSLLNAKANVNLADQYGQTALFHAASENNSIAVELLLKAGADVNGMDKYRFTVLGIALSSMPYVSVPIVQMLIDKGVDVNVAGSSYLESAVDCFDPNLVALLIQSGININQVNSRGTTPLLKAVEVGNRFAIETLLKLGANPNLSNDSGQTPLGAALERAGSDTTLVDAFYYSVLETNNTLPVGALVEMLLDAGASPTLATQGYSHPEKIQKFLRYAQFKHSLKAYTRPWQKLFKFDFKPTP